MEQRSACCVWDFTIWCNSGITKDDLIAWCHKWCKKWIFQIEETQSGRLHFQGRISLKAKSRLTALKKFGPTSNTEWSITHDWKDEHFDFYSSKFDSAIEGPWRDGNDDPIFVPDYLKVDKWHPWQERIISMVGEKAKPRRILYIVDKTGNKGKSTLALRLAVEHKMHYLPMMKDFKDIMRAAMDLPEWKGYFIDSARSATFTEEFWQGIETLKGGYCYDDRYKYNYKVLNNIPHIIIVSNEEPDLSCLIEDRWDVRFINDDLDLETFVQHEMKKNLRRTKKN